MARILLAEDDDSLRGFLVSSLSRAGHDVTGFGDGDAAWEALEHSSFDLLLTDIVMPGLDGIELARRGAEADPAMKSGFHHRLRGSRTCQLKARRRKMPKSSPSPST